VASSRSQSFSGPASSSGEEGRRLGDEQGDRAPHRAGEIEDPAGRIYAICGRPPAKLSRLFPRSPDPPHIDNSRCGVPMEGIVVDTNVFVAAGFNPRSASARVLADIREGRFLLIWNKPTQRETEVILRRIPRLDWEKVADLFRPEGEFTGPVDPEAFVLVQDPDDRKFAALSAAAKRPLLTNDNHLLADLNKIGIGALTPRAFLAREEEDTL
jgi:uncharacterized protein